MIDISDVIDPYSYGKGLMDLINVLRSCEFSERIIESALCQVPGS
jgi:hypothetical protein